MNHEYDKLEWNGFNRMEWDEQDGMGWIEWNGMNRMEWDELDGMG